MLPPTQQDFTFPLLPWKAWLMVCKKKDPEVATAGKTLASSITQVFLEVSELRTWLGCHAKNGQWNCHLRKTHLVGSNSASENEVPISRNPSSTPEALTVSQVGLRSARFPTTTIQAKCSNDGRGIISIALEDSHTDVFGWIKKPSYLRPMFYEFCRNINRQVS
ncbi:Hypothetical predicted protein [Podarcis lilfordi]|uniref:Uncharacterized protein n=1 Tax=Podarcis lilfordi TaxID=74358 RepID=A0AA35P7U1_9SAUR|nr:Hypothetical predicted protein [Podarcis lilfordi]